MLFHSVKLFIKQCKLNLRFTILATICLISSFFSLIFLLERGYYQYIVDVDTEQETKVLYITSTDEDVIKEIYDRIVGDLRLPRLEKATASGNLYSGVFWDVGKAGNVYHTPYGRFFDENEILTNARVALVGTGYLSLFSHDEIDSVWRDGIKINDISFNVIGTYNYNWGDGSNIPSDAFCFSPIPNAVTIPINTFFEAGLTATKLRFVFSEPLNADQRIYLMNFLNSYSGLQDLVIPKTEEMNRTSMLTRMIENVAPFAAIVFLSVVNITSIIIYWLHMEFARLQIYRICGSSSGTIAFIIAVQVSLLVIIGFICSCVTQQLLRFFSPDGVISSMPISVYLIILIGQLAAMLLLVLIRAMRLIASKNLIVVNI